MTITIDKAGRIVVPKDVRQRLGLVPSTELELVDQPDGILLRIVGSGPSLARIKGLTVHQGRAARGSDLDAVLDSVREERIQDLLRI